MSCCIQTLTGTVCLLSGGCVMYTLSCITEAECAEFPTYHSIHTLVVHRNVCYTVYYLHFFIQQVLLSKVPYSVFLPNQNFDLGVIIILLWQLSYVCAMMWWLKCIPRSFHKVYKKREEKRDFPGYNISEYEVIQTLSVIVVKSLLNQPLLCVFFNTNSWLRTIIWKLIISAANEMQSSVCDSWDHLCDSISLMCKWK